MVLISPIQPIKLDFYITLLRKGGAEIFDSSKLRADQREICEMAKYSTKGANIKMIMLNKKDLTKAVIKKLMDRIIWPKDRDSSNPCWGWIGRIDNFHRPLFRLNGKYVKARILVYECFYGPLEENQTLVPTCLTQKCVNPTHLTLVESWNRRKIIIDLPDEVEKNMMNSVVTEILQELP